MPEVIDKSADVEKKELANGTVIGGKYEVLKKIKKGGMSVVYLVADNRLNKNWALKEVDKSYVENYETVKQSLVVEADMLKKLSHPNLPRIVDIIDKKDSYYVVMDYIEGKPLDDTLNEYGAQPQGLVIEWAKQICDVLTYLHTRTPPIIYRDIKPANIMLSPEGHLTLIDFGIAREFKEKNVADTVPLGTKGYAAPEQYGDNAHSDQRTDIYCLGATLYHLLTGKSPAEPPYFMHPIRTINPSFSAGLERILLKCIEVDKTKRYQNCAELMYDLEHYNEIDDKFKKKQVGKLAGFCVPFVMSIASLGFSFFCYQSMIAQQRANYDSQLAVATNMATQSIYDETYDSAVIDSYNNTINIDQSREEGYIRLIDYCSNVEQTQSGLDSVGVSIDSKKGGIQNNDDLLMKMAKLYFGGNYKDSNFNVDYLKAAKYFEMVDVNEYPEAEYFKDLSSALGSFSNEVDWKAVTQTLEQFKDYNAKQILSVNKIINTQLCANVYIAYKREIMASGVDPYEQAVNLLLQAEVDIENLQNDVDLGTETDNSDVLPSLQQQNYLNLANYYYTAYTVDSVVTDYDKSLGYFNLLLSVLEFEEDQKTIHYKIAEVTAQKGNASEIKQQYNSLMEKYPNESKAYLDYAIYCFDNNDLELSKQLYLQAQNCSDVQSNSNYSKLGIRLKNAGLI